MLTWIKSQSKNETNDVGDADELLDEVVGSVQQRKRNEIGSHKNWKNEKRKPFKLCLVKRKIQISYKLEYDNFML